jgi:uncharacterized protein
MKFGLSNETISRFNSVFAQHPEIDEVVIYGSRAKGTYREGSDIDISLKGENLTYALRSIIYQEIDDLNTPYLVDLSVYSLLDSPDLVAHIDRVGKVFYKKTELEH